MEFPYKYLALINGVYKLFSSKTNFQHILACKARLKSSNLRKPSPPLVLGEQMDFQDLSARYFRFLALVFHQKHLTNQICFGNRDVDIVYVGMA